jgi:membrane-bound lytic murein transglycosylase D
MFFLPPAPPAAGAIDLAEPPPPAPPPNPYLSDVPAFLDTPQVPDAKTRADALVRQADQRFQRGKRYYQVKDVPNARREFDAAVDMMLAASGLNPAGRPVYESLLDSMVDAIHGYDLADLGASAGDEGSQFEEAPLEDILVMTFPVDPKLKDEVRAQVAATVSQLPLSVNDAVLGYIHYFSNRGRKSLVNGLARSGRYRPMIQRILEEEGLPQELICLAQAESGFMPRALSRKAAGGMWQFLAWRGQEYGLMRTAYTDDRLDPEKATRAAARHLRDLYQEFGDWYLAIAAYNCGPVTVESAVERTGYADFWELRGRGVLPAETTNYVPIILAMIIMEKNAAAYGIDNVTLDTPTESDMVDIEAPTSLALVSDIAETPVPELAALNPALLKSVAPAGYSIHVPKGSGNPLAAALPLVPAEFRNAWRMHRVAAGETLASIGLRYGVSASRILAVNKLVSPRTEEGDRLLIPAARSASAAKRAVVRPAGKPPVSKPPAAAARHPRKKAPAVLARAATR